MATEAQILANRRNAAKSTGPKTENGKAKSRQNALKHGGRARTSPLSLALPHEDPAEMAERIESWLDDWAPRNAQEDNLVRQAAHLSWKVERGEEVEAAYLARRVRMAQRKPSPSSRRMERVSELSCKLFYDCQPERYHNPPPHWLDEPLAFVAGLEATPEGCRWLLDRWTELRTVLVNDQGWELPDVFRFVRLLGKSGYEAVHDPALNALFLAWGRYETRPAEVLWRIFREREPRRQTACHESSRWRILVDPPKDRAAAFELFRGVIDEQIERLQGRLDEFAEIADAEAADRAALALFDPGPAFDRFRKQQASSEPRAAPEHRHAAEAAEARRGSWGGRGPGDRRDRA